MKAQRLRLRYRVTEVAATLSQRELVRAWEEAASAARLSLAYSEGKRPSAQISVAALLPRGATSDSELIDLFLVERVEPQDALAALAAALPAGIEPVAAREVGVGATSLQSSVRWAEYEVEAPAGECSAAEVRGAIERLLAAESFPWERQREKGVRRYDLRPLVLDLRLVGERDGCFLLSMRLRAEQEMTGRADQVVEALGLGAPCRVHRSRLFLDETPPAVRAYRRLGEPEEG